MTVPGACPNQCWGSINTYGMRTSPREKGLILSGGGEELTRLTSLASASDSRAFNVILELTHIMVVLLYSHLPQVKQPRQGAS